MRDLYERLMPVLDYHRAKLVAAIVLAPILTISLLGLLMTTLFDIPAAVGHRQLSRELSTVEQGRYSVHLAWEESAGGALGPHGVSLEQRMIILPGLYAVKPLDRIELHIPNTSLHQEVDRVYSLKPWLHF